MVKKFDASRFLKAQPVCKGKLHYFDELSSTNDYAKTLIKEGAKSGTLVLAEHQLAGRGRGDNAWHCPAGEGLLFSLIIEPDIEYKLWSRFSIIAGVAFARSLPASTPIQLKWPNDVYIHHKKCAGILTEIVHDKVVIGIGANVLVKQFPKPLQETATSLILEDILIEREVLLANVVTQMIQLGSSAQHHFTITLNQYRERCMLTGSNIIFHSANQLHQGFVLGIHDDGSLLVKEKDGIFAYAEAHNIQIIAPPSAEATGKNKI